MPQVPSRRLDVASQEFAHHAYEHYAELREQSPVIRLLQPDGTEIWLVTRYQDAHALLADPRLAKDPRHGHQAMVNAHFVPPGSAPQEGAPDMLFRDPPDHTRLRRLVQKAFTARRVARLEPRVEEIASELLDATGTRTELDLMVEFALPLPVIVICELLGVPTGDRASVRYWTNRILATDLREEDATPPEDLVDHDMFSYLGGLARRTAPHVDRTLVEEAQPNLLHALIAAKDETGRLDEIELVEMLVLLLIAGHETTVNLIGNGMLALLRNPDQLALLRQDPALLPGAVEEFLRYDGPIERATFRYSVESIQLGNYEIPSQRVVGIALAAADHDPDHLADPARLDVTRPPAAHVAFGHGIHFCLGAPLARLEGRVAFAHLLARFPGIELGSPYEQLRYRAAGHLSRGLATLPVRVQRKP